MKIMHINATDSGSTGKIISDITSLALEQGHESYLCTPNITVGKIEGLKKIKTSFKYEQAIYRRAAKVLGYRYGFAPISSTRIIAKIKRIKPDVVHIHSANMNMVNLYRLLKFLGKRDIPVVVTNHAEFFYTGSCEHAFPCERWKTGCGECPIYRRACATSRDVSAKAFAKMKRAFSYIKRLYAVSVSPYVYERSCQSPILHGAKQRMVANGVNTELFRYIDKNEARAALGLSSEQKILLAVTATFDPLDRTVKGGGYLVELAGALEEHGVRVVVIGTQIKRDVSLPKNLTALGCIYDQRRLAGYYASADLSVTTSRRETFGMTVAESLCVGTPTVGFAAGGPESIAIDEYSEFVSFGDVEALKEAILKKWIHFKDEASSRRMAQCAMEKYESKMMARAYIDIYAEAVKCEGGNTDFS